MTGKCNRRVLGKRVQKGDIRTVVVSSHTSGENGIRFARSIKDKELARASSMY